MIFLQINEMGDVLSPFFSILIFAMAFFTSKKIRKVVRFEPQKAHVENIDSLRGFLAIGVFVSHIDAWFKFLNKGVWYDGVANFYTNLGGVCVSFFFMITSYLFVTKIINADLKPIRWDIFFISRFFRLFPLYLFSLLLILFFVFETSNWVLNVPIIKLLKNIGYWLTFTFISDGIINANQLTGIINAGVVWTLPFEWVFYFSLPLFAFVFSRKKISLIYLISGVLFISLFIKIHGVEVKHVFSFSGGALAPFLIKYRKNSFDFNKSYFSLLIIVLLVIVFTIGNGHSLYTRICLTLIFTLIALGNTIFGLLTSNSMKFLGEICYSTYLLHGIIAFIVMYYLLGFEVVKQYSIWSYYLIFILITPVLVLISYFTFNFIEKPFMLLAKTFTNPR